MQRLHRFVLASTLALALTASTAWSDEHADDHVCAMSASCSAVEAMLATEDADQLRMVSAQVARTLDALVDRPDLAWDDDGRALFDRVRAADFNEDFEAVREGQRPCRVFWFGFLENGGQLVGRHQCRVERRDGSLVVQKLTGQMRFGTVQPYRASAHAFIGRTYLTGHRATEYDPENPANSENENFGNVVGQVQADRGELLILSINERGMAPPDPTFFEVLIVAADTE